MSLTPAQSQAANLASATNVAKTRHGLNDVPPAQWTYEQRTNYNTTFAALIAENPDGFSVEQVSTANHILTNGYDPLENPSFDFSQFAEEVGNSAAKFGFSVSTAVAAGLILYLIGPKIRKALS
jgi:hypothetical protein